MGHQVSTAFAINITLLEFFLVHSKLFLSTFYQLIDSTPRKNRLILDAFYADVLVQSKKYLVNIKRTLK